MSTAEDKINLCKIPMGKDPLSFVASIFDDKIRNHRLHHLEYDLPGESFDDSLELMSY